MKNIDDINLYTWFTDRELDYIPGHFVMTNTPLSIDSKKWIIEKLVGRYSISSTTGSFLLDDEYPAFEDPKEAVFYELTWS